jgi:GT2 family glycosyltransferase
MKKVCVVILNWNGRDLTLRCLEDLRKSDYPALSCVIVDNGSTDGSIEAIVKAYPDVGVIRNAVNLGWSGGSNQGIAWGLAHGADYLLMLNNDVWADPAMISRLVEAATKLQDQAVTIPKIYLGSDPTRYWFARGRINFWTGLFSNPAFNLIDDSQFDTALEVEYASGCCMLMPKGIVECVGGFDHGYFSYVEDVEWSIRSRRAGFRIVLCPTAKLWHDVSVTGKKRPAMMRYYLTRNHLWTLRRYASLLQFACVLLLLPLRSLWRIFRLARAHDAESIAAELRGLKDGLLADVAPASSVGKLQEFEGKPAGAYQGL